MTKIDGCPVPTTQRGRIEESIRQLTEIRDGAAIDLACMPGFKTGIQWEADRKIDIAFCNRSLERLRIELDRC